jgi:mannose-6-phosphate isomerase-like protein (cupin superfamily)
MKILHLEDVSTENIHNDSVFRKSLLKIGDIKGEIQTMNFAWLEKDISLEKHTHEDCIEYFLILEGNGIISIDENNFNIKKGDFVTVEKSEPHSIQNTGDNKLEFISLRVKISS